MSTVSHDQARWLERMKRLARHREGRCLSTEYINNHTKLRWRCKFGHEWEAIPNSVAPHDGFRGSWCPTCAGKLPKEEMLRACQELARNRGGALLSKRYADARTHLRWRCSEGHEWLSIPDSVKRGSWCPVCGGTYPLTLAMVRAYVRDLGGKCISRAYINNVTSLLWRCAEGHEWQARPGHVLEGHWCPICSSGVSERICRAVLESITSVAFPKARPKWLKNARGNQMELDGYAPSLHVAFGYQGHQHYRYVSRFHSSRAEVAWRRADDLLKRRLCRKHGVRLLVIPYRVAHGKLQDYLGKQLRRLGARIVVNMKPLKVEHSMYGAARRRVR